LARFSLRTVWIVACLLAFVSHMHAQEYVFRAFRQAEGLKNLAVRALAIDRSGFLWVGTENGVYRFLGSGFEHFGPEQGIAEFDIEDVFADPDGTVWVGTLENLYRWDGQRFFSAGTSPIHIGGSRHMAAEDASHLLVVDNNRLYRLEHDADARMLSYTPVFPNQLLHSVPELDHLSSVTVVRERSGGQRIWMGCGEKLCSWLDGQTGGGKVTRWGTAKGVPEETWQSVILDPSGTLWAQGQHHVAAMPPGESQFLDRKAPHSDPQSVNLQAPMVLDREGRVIVPAEEGFARWDGTGWRLFGQANGMLRTTHVTGMAFDAAGDLWFGSIGDGLYEWAGYEDWEGWGDEQGLPSSSIWAVDPSCENRVLTGTDKGPAWINPHTGLVSPIIAGHRWTFGPVKALGANRDGSYWAGTLSGAVLRIDPKTGSVQETARLPEGIMSAVQDSTGRVFFTTTGGPWGDWTTGRIYMREAETPSAQPHRIPAADALLGVSIPIYSSCMTPDSAVWFIATDRLVREKDGQWTGPAIKGMPKLHDPLISMSCGADGALWVTGKQTGTWRLTPGASHVDAWQLVLPPELRTLSPLAIFEDRRGWVWLGTDTGLAVWNGRTWRHLTQESGLIWNDVDGGVLSSGPDGSLWVGTSGGLARLTHPERVFDPTPLALSVTDIRRGDKVYPPSQKITLPWAPLALHFQISSPAMRNRSELVFRYRMEGLQTDWVESQSGAVEYFALPPGEFTFIATASNPGLSAFAAMQKVSIRILPPWWRSSWFYALCGLAFVLLFVAGERLRVRHLRQKSQRLERLVSARTRELDDSRKQLLIQATYDSLTGLLNHGAILRTLAAEIERARREDKTLVAVLADLDHFKRVNDTYGHLAGDAALRQFAAAIGASIRVCDYAGRYGGEEFLLILNDISVDVVEQRLTNLHARISNLEIRAKDIPVKITCSMGATVFNPSDRLSGTEPLLACADLALYEAKDAGRNRVVYRKICALDANPRGSATSPEN
jgi:diguanylate cyclase (GGDEF)-like protein